MTELMSTVGFTRNSTRVLLAPNSILNSSTLLYVTLGDSFSEDLVVHSFVHPEASERAISLVFF